MIFDMKKITKNNSAKKIIRVTRQSVCMGDDCTAPNENKIEVFREDSINDVLSKIANHLPQMQNVIWAIDTGKKVLAYITIDENEKIYYEQCVGEQCFFEMEIERLHCSYFHSRSFDYGISKIENIEGYSQCNTLLEKVKYQMSQKFFDELKIKGGGIQFWGEWFGRPHDNYHVIKSVEWRKDFIMIEFDGGESLYVENPSVILNENNRFCIKSATKILWIWYYYGKPQTVENLFVRQYTKSIKDGVIKRVEGRRKDVKDQDGLIFQPQSMIALIIE